MVGETPRDPDPTPRTVDAIYREIGALKELFQTWRVAYDEAIKLLQTKSDNMPTPALVMADVKALAALVDERFKSISLQFQAAKEVVGEQNRSSAMAISKNEAATSKQVDQQAALITATTGALRDMIDDLKGRLIRMEEGKIVTAVSTTAQKTDQQVSHVNTMGYVGIGVAIGLAAFAFFANQPEQSVVERVQIERPAP